MRWIRQALLARIDPGRLSGPRLAARGRWWPARAGLLGVPDGARVGKVGPRVPGIADA